MKLVVHIGAHKTATTSIQKALAKNRAQLIKASVWYPGYSEVFPSIPDHYAHLDVAKGLMSDSERFTPEQAALFFERLHEHAPKMRGVDAVLISAEPFYRGCMPGESPYWQRRAQYVAKVRESIPFENIEVVVVLRRQDDYLESLYNEHVKVTRYPKDIWSFLSEYQHRFEYRNQIKLWTEYFPVLKVLTFEELVEQRTPAQSFLEAVFGLRGILFAEVEGESNVSLPVDLIEFKRFLNRTFLSRPELREVVSMLELVAAARTEGRTDRMSRLSADDRRGILARFDGDNDWVNRTYFFDRPGGLFPSDVKTDSIAPELDLKRCMEIVSEILRGQVLSRKR
jgi:hypothetical protein